MSIVGLDIGTTGAKAVAFRLDGRVIASAYREYNMLSPRPGQLELDPVEVLSKIKDAVRELVSLTRDDPPQTIAWSALGEAVVPVDEQGAFLGNAIIGFDCRGDEEVKELHAQLSQEECFAITGHPINSFHTLCKLMWWRAHRPEVFARAHLWLGFPDLFVASLGLPPSIDYALASRTLLLDVNDYRWSPRMLALAGIREDQLAVPVAPGARIGVAGKNDLGLPEDCVVGAGVHDQPAGILGTGTESGEAMYAIGTVVCLGVRLAAAPDPQVMLASNLCAYPTYGRKQYVSLAWNFTGGSLLKWYRDQFAGEERREAEASGRDVYDIICADLPAEPTTLLTLPYFTTTGTPFLDTRARGAIFGLHLTTARREIAKAFMEGVSYDIMLNTELLRNAGVEISRYKAIGGAARSEVWMQLEADILGKPVVTLRATEGASLGAALLGAAAGGLVDDAEAAGKALAVPERVYEPDPARHAAYRRRFDLYRRLYETNRDILHALDALAKEGK